MLIRDRQTPFTGQGKSSEQDSSTKAGLAKPFVSEGPQQRIKKEVSKIPPISPLISWYCYDKDIGLMLTDT